MQLNQELLNQEQLKDVLNYNPETGEFTWINGNGSRVHAGDIAGCLDKDGYIVIGLKKHSYKAHRLAWLFMTGNWPEFIIDHIDGINISNFNKWSNLRQLTIKDNSRHKVKNNGTSTKNTTGYRGVHMSNGKFRARIKVNGKSIHLGLFINVIDASNAYENARLKYFTNEDVDFIE